MRAKRPVLKVTKPMRSKRFGSGSRDSSTFTRASTNTKIPTGMLTRKIQRQPSPVTSAPPITGPVATASPVIAPKTPKAVPLSRPLNDSESRASDVANMKAPPMPWNARERAKTTIPVAKPHSAEPATKIATPMRKRSRRPFRSARVPAVKRSDASASAYASMTHCNAESEELNDPAMSGKATFTIVRSRSNMKTPMHTTARVDHLRAIRTPIARSFLWHAGRSGPVARRCRPLEAEPHHHTGMCVRAQGA